MSDLRTIDKCVDISWAGVDSVEQQLTLNSELLFGLEIINHDGAAHVFKSPRPSYTLNELQEREARECLVREHHSRYGSPLSNAAEEFNVWVPQQHRVEGPAENNATEGATERQRNENISDLSGTAVLIGISEAGDIQWKDEVATDEEPETDLEDHPENFVNGADSSQRNAWSLNGLSVEERDIWAETAKQTQGAPVLALQNAADALH